MPEHDSRDTEPTAPATPRVSGELAADLGASDTPLPESSMRNAQLPDEPAVVSEPGDTLLSAGRPADRLELLLDDRFATLDARLTEHEQRLAALEQRKSVRAVAPEPQKPWLWLAFLIGLVVVFQVLRAMR